MAFENCRIQSTRNGSGLTVGYREDLEQADVLALSLTSTVGVSSVRWEIAGRPEFSVAGGTGSNPWPLASALTASFTVDLDNGGVHRDGTYTVWATINPGSPGETRKTCIFRRLTGLTIPAPGGQTVPLAKLGPFESLEDTSVHNLLAGWATMLNRWLELLRGGGGGGGGGVASVSAGTGISITGTATNPIVNNTGVLLVTAGTGISVTGTVAVPIVNNTGVLSVAAGTNVTVTGTAQNPIINASAGGVLTVTAGPGISITGSGANPIVNNTGVLSITAGVNISLGGTAQNPIINAAGGGGGGANPTLFRRSNIAGMIGIDASVFLTSDAHICEVLTVGDYYKYVPGTTLTPDGITVINNTGGGGGQWQRLLIPNLAWRAQATWSIDEGNISTLASDENTGVDDTHPLRTGAEFARRMGRCVLPQVTTIRWMSDTTHYSLDLSGINAGAQSAAGTLTAAFPLVIVGVTTLVRAGTFSAVSQVGPWELVDSSLGTSWAASACLSTSASSRFIRTPDGAKHAFMGYEPLAKTVDTSPTTGYSNTYAFGSDGTPVATFVIEDSYEVINVPKFPRVKPPQSIPDSHGTDIAGCYFIYLDMQDVFGGSNEYRMCGWRAASALSCEVRGGKHVLRGCGFTFGGTVQGSQACSLNRSIVLGDFQFVDWAGDSSGQANVIANNGTVSVTHGSRGRLGVVHAYDCAFVPLTVTSRSNPVLDEVRGSGNFDLIINVQDTDCSVSCPQSAAFFHATTAAAHPIKIVGKTFDYADLPVVRLSKNASITVTT